MTPMRWLIAAFWVFVIVMCAKSFYDYNSRLEHEETAQEEKHYFAPGMVPTPAPPPAAAAPDVRMTGWYPHEDPQAAQFTAKLVVKNFGQKKATNIQVRIQPYVTSADSSSQVGPDEVLNPTTVDTMATYYQWIEFPDLGPGESYTNELTFPARPDAQPREHFDAKINFDTPKDQP
jgi:hypothetical protein